MRYKALRDMGASDFADTVRLMGFTPDAVTGGGCWYEHPEFPGHYFGTVLNRKTLRVMRRQTIARLKAQLDRCRNEREAAHV